MHPSSYGFRFCSRFVPQNGASYIMKRLVAYFHLFSEENLMRRSSCLRYGFAIVTCLAISSLSVAAQTQLSAELREKIEKLVTDTLAKSGVPSASVAIVKDGQIAYAKAYGDARLE